jgi:hypothetical protein
MIADLHAAYRGDVFGGELPRPWVCSGDVRVRALQPSACLEDRVASLGPATRGKRAGCLPAFNHPYPVVGDAGNACLPGKLAIAPVTDSRLALNDSERGQPRAS